MGIIIQIMRITTLIAFDVISRHNYLKSEYNVTVQYVTVMTHMFSVKANYMIVQMV